MDILLVPTQAEEADEFAAVTPVDRLLFVVHGIGQNLAGSNIAGAYHTDYSFVMVHLHFYSS